MCSIKAIQKYKFDILKKQLNSVLNDVISI